MPNVLVSSIIMTLPPPFITDRLHLRAVSINDIPSYEKHFVDYEVIRHLSSNVPWPYPDNGVHDYIMYRVLSIVPPFVEREVGVLGVAGSRVGVV